MNEETQYRISGSLQPQPTLVQADERRYSWDQWVDALFARDNDRRGYWERYDAAIELAQEQPVIT